MISIDENFFITSLSIPLDWGFSKNRKYVSKWSKELSKKYVDLKNIIFYSLELKRVVFIKKKLWIIIKVTKPTYSGDSHNFIEGICDGVKLYTKKICDMDDNMYSTVTDWEVTKAKKPGIEIRIYQYQEENDERSLFH